jgi:uncharacterized membrane protein YfcA
VSLGDELHAAVDRAGADRRRRRRQREFAAWGVSVAVTLGWGFYILVWGHVGRVADNLTKALVMVFGSLVAGSTPQGGGAVAFPVFTKVFDIPAQVARTFSLSIQAVGMGVATVTILLRGRRVDRRSLAWGIPPAIVGLLFGLFVLGRPDQPFWPSRLPGEYVKVTFTIVLAAMAIAMWIEYRSPLVERRSQVPTSRTVSALLVLMLFCGGVASSLTGSGTDVFLYVLVAVVLGVSPEVAVPTSVIAMAVVSVLGLLLLGVVDGQLDITLIGDQVVAVGGQPVGLSADGIAFDAASPGVPADRFDEFGLWLAAVPIVAWGAPIGSFVAARASDRALVRFVIALATLEVASTAIFLPELHRDAVLITASIVGLTITAGCLLAARRARVRLSGGPSLVGIGGDAVDATRQLGPSLRPDGTNRTERR